MATIQVKIKKLRANAVIPTYQTEGAAACDLTACAEVVLPPRGRGLVPVGFALECEGAAALIFARSGLAAKRGIALSNGVGLVDPDYRGEVQVGLINNTDEAYTVAEGDRVAQLLFVPFATAEFHVAEELSQTARGSGGFGSTAGESRMGM